VENVGSQFLSLRQNYGAILPLRRSGPIVGRLAGQQQRDS
jgi:hypothetical protein